MNLAQGHHTVSGTVPETDTVEVDMIVTALYSRNATGWGLHSLCDSDK